jgi:hypothetical protein
MLVLIGSTENGRGCSCRTGRVGPEVFISRDHRQVKILLKPEGK